MVLTVYDSVNVSSGRLLKSVRVFEQTNVNGFIRDLVIRLGVVVSCYSSLLQNESGSCIYQALLQRESAERTVNI